MRWISIVLLLFVIGCTDYLLPSQPQQTPLNVVKRIHIDGGGGGGGEDGIDGFVWVKYTWTAPTTGTPVKIYEGQVSENEGLTWGEPRRLMHRPIYIFPFEHGKTYQVRVRGVDAEERAGPWSEPSEPYTVEVRLGNI